MTAGGWGYLDSLNDGGELCDDVASRSLARRIQLRRCDSCNTQSGWDMTSQVQIRYAQDEQGQSYSFEVEVYRSVCRFCGSDIVLTAPKIDDV